MNNPIKFAVVKINKAQYKVTEGLELDIQKIEGEKGKKLKFEDVLLKVNKDKIEIGQPIVSSSSITAEIITQKKAKKVRTLKYKAKSRYRRRTGHRQLLTTIKINKIL